MTEWENINYSIRWSKVKILPTILNLTYYFKSILYGTKVDINPEQDIIFISYNHWLRHEHYKSIILTDQLKIIPAALYLLFPIGKDMRKYSSNDNDWGIDARKNPALNINLISQMIQTKHPLFFTRTCWI